MTAATRSPRCIRHRRRSDRPLRREYSALPSAGHFWPQRPDNLFLYAAGGHISFNSERNMEKNAAQNQWFWISLVRLRLRYKKVPHRIACTSLPAAAPTHRAAVPYCVGAGVPDSPLLVPFMPLAGIFRAPARHPFARGGKRMQKRRQRPVVFGFPSVRLRLRYKKVPQ